MKIYPRTVYRMDGEDYQSMKQIDQEIENRIGKIIDRASALLGPKERIAIMDVILANKSELRDLLSTDYQQ